MTVNQEKLQEILDKYDIKLDGNKSHKKSKYDEAMDYAYAEEYDRAIPMLDELSKKGNQDARNNMGVCYERQKNYDKALSVYLDTSLMLAKENALHLFNKDRVEFSKEKYLECCKYLIDRNNQYGYTFLSMLFESDRWGLKDEDRAFEILMEGFKHCFQCDELVFRTGYLFESGIGCRVDHHRSHILYSTIIDKEDQITAKYNYALQCYYGRGCRKNMKRAIKYFELAASKGYKDAIECLDEIHEEEKKKLEKKNKKSQEEK